MTLNRFCALMLIVSALLLVAAIMNISDYCTQTGC